MADTNAPRIPKVRSKEAALELVAKGVCLSCQSSKPKTRGLCGTCYQQAQRGQGSVSYEELVEAGLMLPDYLTKPGRKPKQPSLILDLLNRLGGTVETAAKAAAPEQPSGQPKKEKRATR